MTQLKTVLEQLEEKSYLAENIKLDFSTVNSAHKKAADYGNNVAVEMEQRFRSKILNIDATKDIVDQLTLMAFHLLSNQKKAHFLCPGNNQNQLCKDDAGYEASFTRYISMKTFCRHIQQDAENDTEGGLLDIQSGGIDEKRRMIDRFFKRLNSKSMPVKTFAKCWLGIPSPLVAKNRHLLPLPVWITPGKTAPHDHEDFQTLQSESERAKRVVRTLALPGYEEEKNRKEMMGIVAIRFFIRDDIDVFKPTILDAIDSPLFFPGKTAEAHGRTIMLNNQYLPSGQHGAKEFICKSFQVPVKTDRQLMVEKIGYFEEAIS